MSKAFINGNKHDLDKPIPYTAACYDEITDTDYPIPHYWRGDYLIYDMALMKVITHREAAERLKDRPMPWHG